MHGGGSRGGPVASFTRTTSRHSSLQRQALVMRLSPVGTDQCAIFRIVATVIDYFSLLVTACHRLCTYHCLAPVLAGKNEHRLVLFAGKSEHHLDLVNTCFTFMGHRSKYIRERAHAASVSVAYTYAPRTQPIVRAPPSDLERELFALPARLGGLGIPNPASSLSKEFLASISISAPLSHRIERQQPDYPWEIRDAQLSAKQEACGQRTEDSRSAALAVKSALSSSLKYTVDLAQERGASTWLTSLPLEEFGFSLHKGAFRDALALRYGWLPSNTPTNCACGTHFTVEHSLSCPKGGFPSIRHNEVRDTVGGWLSEVCSDVCIEPSLQPLFGETLNGASAITEDGARLDIAANGFWGGRYERTYFDVRVFNPLAPSNRQQSLAATYRKHERAKIRAYEQRVREVEHSSFTPLVTSLTGGCGNAANESYKRLASMLAEKWDQPYSSTLAWMRCKLSFALLRSSIQCLRGARSSRGRACRQHVLPTDLVLAETNISL